MIKLHNLHFETYLSQEKIELAIDKVAVAINEEYRDKNPIFIVVLNGAFRFASTLISKFEGDCEVEFVKMSSYDGTESTGNVMVDIPLDFEIEDRDLIAETRLRN
ncbi:MAG: phosphoribosyltransferase family protein [Leeuwenhoekiella sp.]